MTAKEIAKMLDLNKVMELLALNEISGKTEVAYRFSYAGTGKSGYSFGRSQFDVSNNSSARAFLRTQCGFTADDVQRLLNMDKDIKDLQAELKNFKKEIDQLDLDHVKGMVEHIAGLEGLPQMNVEAFIDLVDYHNQFCLHQNGMMHNYLKSLKVVTAKDILAFKLELKWGKMHPQDVRRRWNNIHNNL